MIYKSMDSSNYPKFTALFIVILCIELICGSIESLQTLHYFTKPAILISLIIFFYIESRNVSKSLKWLVLAALAFSLVGDVFLMFVDQSPNYFMLGLISFFLAHLFYCWIFFTQKNSKTNPIGLIIVLTIFAFGLFYLLKENLGDLLIPVIFYIIIILTMVITAFLRKKRVSKKSFIYVFLGAILFVISDSILALNKFYMPLKFSSISIMLTYGLAQFYIVTGLLKEQ
ncbi:MAG: lysoplasmalogenase [Gelidibacter sp.]